MIQLELPYGRGKMPINLAKSRLAAVLEADHSALGHAPDEDEQKRIVQNALENPIGSPRLCELSRGKREILLITSDHTRPVPSKITLPLYLAEIRRENPDVNITILIATGMHRPTTEDELRAKFGDTIVDNEKIVIHRAGNDDEMEFFGILPSGGELWLNRLAKSADLVISEGFVEPHFFAGFSGGRKSILPGIAAKRTVLYNHNSRFIRDENARAGSLDGNPIHRDMLFAASAAKLSFILNVLIDSEKRVIAAFSGDPTDAHLAGCELSARLCGVKAVVSDIAITSNGGYPLDQNVYQSVKGMTAAEACVKDGGVVIICAALGDGHGGEDFYRWFADRENAVEVARDIEKIPPEATIPDQWEAQILARIQMKADCIFVTEPENRELIEAMHMRYSETLDEALELADRLMGDDATVTVIPDGVGVVVR